MPVDMNNREYRRIDASNFEARTENENEMIVEGYATTFDQEYTLTDYPDYKVVESIDKNAFANTDMSDVIMQYDHVGRVFARIKNNTLGLDIDEHGLKVRANLGGTDLGRQLYQEISGGYTDKMSFGFTVATDEITEERDNTNNKTVIHRKITGIKKLYDVSAVSLPANDATEISARSCGDGFIEAARREAASIMERQRKIKRIKLLMEVANNDD